MQNIFKKLNLKSTKGREKIVRIIQNADLPISAEEIYSNLSKESDINFSTVYRTLATLCENNILLKQVMQDGVAYYQENKNDHKHLLICKECNKKIPMEFCPLQKELKKIVEKKNFKITSHNIEVYGVCNECDKVDINKISPPKK